MKITVEIKIFNLIATVFMVMIALSIFSGFMHNIVQFSSVSVEIGVAFLSIFIAVFLAMSTFKLVKT